MTLTASILLSVTLQMTAVLKPDDLSFMDSLARRSSEGREFSTYLTERHLQPLPEARLGQEALAHSNRWMEKTLQPSLVKEALKIPWSGRPVHEPDCSWAIFTKTWRKGMDRLEWVDMGQVAVLYIGHGEGRVLTSREEAQDYAQEVLHRFFRVEGNFKGLQPSFIHESLEAGQSACYSGYARRPKSSDKQESLTWTRSFYFVTDGSHTAIRFNFYDDALEVLRRMSHPKNRFKDP